MKRSPCSLLLLVLVALSMCGCGTTAAHRAATDLALTGAGGVLGYQVSGGRPEATAAGAVVGYAAAKVAQSAQDRALRDAEQAGYDRAMNQAVKQQYWIMQNQQKSLPLDGASGPRLVPVVIPETKISGVIVNAHVEYLRAYP